MFPREAQARIKSRIWQSIAQCDLDLSALDKDTSERFLNLGDIMIRSHDPNTPLLSLMNIREPKEVFNILRRAVRDARKEHNLTFQEEM